MHRFLNSAMRKGFTLLELGVVIAILGVLATAVTLNTDWEQGEATLVKSLQHSISSAYNHVLTNTNSSPLIFTGLQRYLNGVVVGNNNHVTSVSCNAGTRICLATLISGKTAQFLINTDASVNLVTLTGFSNYGVQDGAITKL